MAESDYNIIIPQHKHKTFRGDSMNLTRKILSSHLAEPYDMKPGSEIFIKVDHTLTHDINAVMTYLAFEAVGLSRTQVELSVSYLDHNLLYLDHKTHHDHIYLQSAPKKYGVYVSQHSNGICHAVHVTSFAKPPNLSMGADSHTPHGDSIGMLCIGVVCHPQNSQASNKQRRTPNSLRVHRGRSCNALSSRTRYNRQHGRGNGRNYINFSQ